MEERIDKAREKHCRGRIWTAGKNRRNSREALQRKNLDWRKANFAHDKEEG